MISVRHVKSCKTYFHISCAEKKKPRKVNQVKTVCFRLRSELTGALWRRIVFFGIVLIRVAVSFPVDSCYTVAVTVHGVLLVTQSTGKVTLVGMLLAFGTTRKGVLELALELGSIRLGGRALHTWDTSRTKVQRSAGECCV